MTLNTPENNELLSSKFTKMVNSLSEEDFKELQDAITQRLGSPNPSLSAREIEILMKTRKEIAENLQLTNDQKVHWVRVVNKKLWIEK